MELDLEMNNWVGNGAQPRRVKGTVLTFPCKENIHPMTLPLAQV